MSGRLDAEEEEERAVGRVGFAPARLAETARATRVATRGSGADRRGAPHHEEGQSEQPEPAPAHEEYRSPRVNSPVTPISSLNSLKETP
jgi:hypothetical protein